MRTGSRRAMSLTRAGLVSDVSIPPFPTQQMLVLALCRISEPIALTSIAPYVYKMVADFDETTDSGRIPFAAAMVTFYFTLGEFLTGFMWGRVSDKVGRKPVLMIGLAGTGLSVLMFGCAPSYSWAITARLLGGLLNGNQGVMQTTVAELAPVKAHQPHAFAVLPLVSAFGAIIGPFLGGWLASPVDNFPSFFRPGSLWDRFPYMLPNLICAVFVTLSLVVGFLFLEETHLERRTRRDPGIELGNSLAASFRAFAGLFWTAAGTFVVSERKQADGKRPLLECDEHLPGYNSVDDLTDVASSDSSTLRDDDDIKGLAKGRPPRDVTTIYTKNVILTTIQYGILAYHTMTFESCFPLILTLPVQPNEPRLPFNFGGGFGYEPGYVGTALTLSGVWMLLSNRCIATPLLARTGALKLTCFVATIYPLLYLVTPYLTVLPDRARVPGIVAVVIWKCTLATLAYPCHSILVFNAAPTPLVLGTINGLVSSTASLARALAPLFSGFLLNLGSQTGYMGLLWWVTALVALAGAVLVFRITEDLNKTDPVAFR